MATKLRPEARKYLMACMGRLEEQQQTLRLVQLERRQEKAAQELLLQQQAKTLLAETRTAHVTPNNGQKKYKKWEEIKKKPERKK